MLPPRLPTELWLEIFRWATLTPSTEYYNTTTYQPFQAILTDARDESLAVKNALSRVCRMWNQLTKDLLYEDLCIPNKESIGKIRELLHGDPVLSRTVQRIYLPYSSSVTEAKATYVADVNVIIRECSDLRTLVRPLSYKNALYASPFEFAAEACPPLPTLKRLDWWHHNEASRTGGINSLMDVLRAAPNVEYLSLGGQLWLSFLDCPSIELPMLTTLRLRRVNILFVQQICKWSLPSLRTVIVDTIITHYPLLDLFWETFGAQLRTVELGRSLKFLTDETAIHNVLTGCPNLEELNYYVQFTQKPYPPREPHASLAVVGLNCQRPDMPVNFWLHLEDHFRAWSHSSYPALKQIVLYDSPKTELDERPLQDATYTVRGRGCKVTVA
ncbi:unnamed protein product [Somion occarium]|uniref:F-box domain-containing protein n=1 Tax=Somion occarium TaxID=3059160 RepID=A0ABP1DDQ9_9APHY